MAKAPHPVFLEDSPCGLTPDQEAYADAFGQAEKDMVSLDKACVLIDEVLDALSSKPANKPN